MKCICISWGGQEEDAEPRYRPGAYRGLHGRPQAGRVTETHAANFDVTCKKESIRCPDALFFATPSQREKR